MNCVCVFVSERTTNRQTGRQANRQTDERTEGQTDIQLEYHSVDSCLGLSLSPTAESDY